MAVSPNQCCYYQEDFLILTVSRTAYSNIAITTGRLPYLALKVLETACSNVVISRKTSLYNSTKSLETAVANLK